MPCHKLSPEDRSAKDNGLLLRGLLVVRAADRIVDRPRFDVRPFAETGSGSGYFHAFTVSFYVKLEPEIATQIVMGLQFHLFLWRRTLDRVVAIYYGLLEDDDE